MSWETAHLTGFEREVEERQEDFFIIEDPFDLLDLDLKFNTS